MDETYLFSSIKNSLNNAKSNVKTVIDNYNQKVNEKLQSGNKDDEMDVYRTLLVFMMKKAHTLESMNPKSDSDRWKNERINKALEIRKRVIENYAKISGTDIEENNTPEEIIKKSNQIFEKEAELWKDGPMCNMISEFKKEIMEKYCAECKYVFTILKQEPESHKLLPARSRENEYMNEIVDAHFATADYNGIIGYSCRAVNGNGFHGSFKDGKPLFEYLENPFADEDKQNNPKIVKLKNPVVIALTDSGKYEPVFDFSVDRDGNIGFRFGGEMISRDTEPLNYEKIELNYIDKSIFKDIQFKAYDSNGNLINLNDKYFNEEITR